MSEFGFNVPRCPRCQSLEINRSRFRLADLIWILLLRKPCRCGTCKHRFSTWLPLPPAKNR
jgi:predicted Zn-ribbon and HTH transcriptional regulator